MGIRRGHTFVSYFPGFSNVYHFACVWPTALKLGCITNFDTLFLVMGFISLVDEIQSMLISSRHICIRSFGLALRRLWLSDPAFHPGISLALAVTFSVTF